MRKNLIYQIYFLLFTFAAAPVVAQTKLDSLRNLIAHPLADTSKVKCFNAISILLRKFGNIDSSFYYAEKARTTANNSIANCKDTGKIYLTLEKGLQVAYSNLGNISLQKANYMDALNLYQKSVEICKKFGDKKGQTYVYTNIAIVYTHVGKYPEALSQFFSVLKIQEELKDSILIASVYNNIGLLYITIGNLDDALKNYRLALDIYLKIKDKDGCASLYNNIGVISKDRGENDLAINYYFKSLDLNKQTGNRRAQASNYDNIGGLYLKLAEENKNKDSLNEYLKKSILYINLSLSIRKDMDDKFGILSCDFNLAVANLLLHKLPEATQFTNEGFAMAQKIGSSTALMLGYKELSQLDSTKRDFKSGFDHYKLFILYRDSLINETNTKQIVQAQMQYSFEKKSISDSIKNAEEKKRDNLKHDQEIHQQKLYTYGGAIGFVLMLLVAGVSYRAYRQKGKANEIISRQKELVEEKQKAILDSIHYAKRIQKSLMPTEKYIDKNIERLKNKL